MFEPIDHFELLFVWEESRFGEQARAPLPRPEGYENATRDNFIGKPPVRLPKGRQLYELLFRGQLTSARVVRPMEIAGQYQTLAGGYAVVIGEKDTAYYYDGIPDYPDIGLPFLKDKPYVEGTSVVSVFEFSADGLFAKQWKISSKWSMPPPAKPPKFRAHYHPTFHSVEEICVTCKGLRLNVYRGPVVDVGLTSLRNAPRRLLHGINALILVPLLNWNPIQKHGQQTTISHSGGKGELSISHNIRAGWRRMKCKKEAEATDTLSP
ncbi:MAG: hypothetical protein ACPG06_01900 [Alphaproteobacteria bacterium]